MPNKRQSENSDSLLLTADEAHALNKGQLGYGEKRVKGQETGHRREIENIAKMRELRSQGFSYHKIADVFNAMSIPTKNRGSRWHATTVMKILKNRSG